jgi:cytochrome c oxidase assembly protein subunit 11
MKPTARDRNLIVAAACGAVVGAMVALSYAAVPLYNWFCHTTGFAGTTQVATAVPGYHLTIGAYFQKINCFCFTEQRLKAGEKQDMTVVFYVDPALAKDAEQDDLNTITLSYTFYPAREPPRGMTETLTPRR